MASGLFNPRKIESVKNYLTVLSDNHGLPPRRMMYDDPNLQFENGVESKVLAFDTLRERDNDIGRNYS